MIEVQEREIDGKIFRFNPLMADKARRMLVGLVNRFGGSFAAGIEGMSDADFQEGDLEKDIALLLGKFTKSLGGIVRQISGNLDPEYYENITDTFGERSEMKIVDENQKTSWVKLSKDVRKMEFATSLLTEFKWVTFCLEVQYADFFGLARTASEQAIALRAMAAGATPSGLDSLTDSIGESSASPPAESTQAR
jgi:hypothetical protein